MKTDTFRFRRSDTLALADGSKMSVGDRFIWRDMFGIGGAIVACKVAAICSNRNVYSAAAQLNIEPSATLAQLTDWIRDTSPVPTRLPIVATGIGGPYAVSYDEIYAASCRGNLRLATGTEEERVSLTKMPDWWPTRHEDLARQRAEEAGHEDALRTMFRVLRKLTAMFALAEPIPGDSRTRFAAIRILDDLAKRM